MKKDVAEAINLSERLTEKLKEIYNMASMSADYILTPNNGIISPLEEDIEIRYINDCIYLINMGFRNRYLKNNDEIIELTGDTETFVGSFDEVDGQLMEILNENEFLLFTLQINKQEESK